MSFTQKLKIEKQPTIWVIEDKRYIGLFNSDKGVAQRIRADGKYEIHPYSDLAAINDGTYKGEMPKIIVGAFECKNKDILCVGVGFNTTWLSPHSITQEKIDEGKNHWEKEFSNLSKTKIAVLLGGNCWDFKFTSEMAREMAQKIAKKASEIGDSGASLIITNSHRTDDCVTEAFVDEIKKAGISYFLYDCKDKTKPNPNPYPALLGLVDAVIVTGDSQSMCCEANMSRQPVYIYKPEELKHYEKERQKLYELGVAKPFLEFEEKGIEKWNYEPLDIAGEMAKKVREMLKENAQKASFNSP